MADASYELVEHPLRNGISMIALREKGSESFIESLNRGKTRQRAAAIVRSIERLLQNGLDWGFASKTVKRLHGNYGDIVLYETRCNGQVIRVMTYIHGGANGTPVFLFDFDGHKARSSIGGISHETLRRGEQLAVIAKELMNAQE